ncbi:cation diffusion facilitator family transporter [Rhizobium tubonense]|nr:cation diffusion facilitator family transporter [Rhizobium tubonense]
MVISTVRQHHINISQMTTRLVVVGLFADFSVALIKFAAAYLSSSSSMMSEGVHSLIDVSTGLILLYGIANSRRPPTLEHQLGYGRELYFWNFAVAILIFSLGAGVAFVDGIHQMLHPVQLSNVAINFAILAISAVVEVASLTYTIRSIDRKRGHQSFHRYLYVRRDPTSLTVVFGGEASILGLAITAIGTALSITQNNPIYDGAASIAISVILAIAAVKLAAESKSLLIGVPADPAVAAAIMADVASSPAVLAVNGATTVHLAPEQLLVALSVWFREDMRSGEIEEAITAIEDRFHRERPEIIMLFVTPQTPKRYRQQQTYAMPTVTKPQLETGVH